MERESAKKTDPPPDAETDASTDRVAEERGGPKGLEPTRYGDWEQKGRCTDF